MKTKRRNYGRKVSKKFGVFLMGLRREAKLTQERAAYELGLRGKQPGAYLCQIEKGLKPIPEAALLRVSRVYQVSEEEVLRRAYWPQLALPFLNAAMPQGELPKKIEEYLEKHLKELEEEETRRVIQYVEFLLIKRKIAK